MISDSGLLFLGHPVQRAEIIATLSQHYSRDSVSPLSASPNFATGEAGCKKHFRRHICAYISCLPNPALKSPPLGSAAT